MKVVTVIIVAVAVNIGLYLMMEAMVSRDRVRVLDGWETQTIDFVRTEAEDTSKTKDRRRKPPPKPEEIDRPRALTNDLLTDTTSLPSPLAAMNVTSLLGAGGIGLGGRLVDGEGASVTTMLESDLIPISKFPPRYPPQAINRNIEGHVEVSFEVDTDGSVRNPTIVSSEPGDMFVDSALDAVMRWRYQPPAIDGVPTRVRVRAWVDYELD